MGDRRTPEDRGSIASHRMDGCPFCRLQLAAPVLMSSPSSLSRPTSTLRRFQSRQRHESDVRVGQHGKESPRRRQNGWSSRRSVAVRESDTDDDATAPEYPHDGPPRFAIQPTAASIAASSSSVAALASAVAAAPSLFVGLKQGACCGCFEVSQSRSPTRAVCSLALRLWCSSNCCILPRRVHSHLPSLVLPPAACSPHGSSLRRRLCQNLKSSTRCVSKATPPSRPPHSPNASSWPRARLLSPPLQLQQRSSRSRSPPIRLRCSHLYSDCRSYGAAPHFDQWWPASTMCGRLRYDCEPSSSTHKILLSVCPLARSLRLPLLLQLRPLRAPCPLSFPPRAQVTAHVECLVSDARKLLDHYMLAFRQAAYPRIHGQWTAFLLSTFLESHAYERRRRTQGMRSTARSANHCNSDKPFIRSAPIGLMRCCRCSRSWIRPPTTGLLVSSTCAITTRINS